MNQARTTYQSDYTPRDWLENNFVSDIPEFCSTENVEECLKYISQEFCALGYPSIYSYSSDCASAVNCDIVKFLNVSYELLKNNKEHIQAKDVLENRNQRLWSDLNIFTKKNSQLKNILEQTERKLCCSVEKERQLKEKNEQLSQLLKTQKEENKKLIAQLRQQKIANQHEIRKYENTLNHVKTKLNQLLSDKTPNKKLATISASHILPRNTGQRGKWKMGTAATTGIEDMYKSVLTSYETRCQNLHQELNSFHQCLQSVLLQVLNIVSVQLNDVDDRNNFSLTHEFVLSEIKSVSRDVKTFEDKFKYLLCIWQEIAPKKISETNKNLEEEVNILKSKISEYEKIIHRNEEFSQAYESRDTVNDPSVKNNNDTTDSLPDDFIKKEKMKLEEEKLAFSKSLENIEKEKAELSLQKLALLRLAMQQKTAPTAWHQGLNTLPAISVITSRNEPSRISNINELKSSLSLTDRIAQNRSPGWDSSGQFVNKILSSKSDSNLLSESGSSATSSVFSPVTANVEFSNSDLPSWAMKSPEAQNVVFEDTHNTLLEACRSVSSGEIELPNESSSEELNLLRLKAAIQDIEKKRAASS